MTSKHVTLKQFIIVSEPHARLQINQSYTPHPVGRRFPSSTHFLLVQAIALHISETSVE